MDAKFRLTSRKFVEFSRERRTKIGRISASLLLHLSTEVSFAHAKKAFSYKFLFEGGSKKLGYATPHSNARNLENERFKLFVLMFKINITGSQKISNCSYVFG